MIHISTLNDDFYHVSPDGTALIGRHKRRIYALGQYIMVQVERVDRFKRQIDFRVTLRTDKELNKALCKPFKGQTVSASRKVPKNLAKKRHSALATPKPPIKGRRRSNPKGK